MLESVDVKFFKMAVGMDNIGKESGVDVAARCSVCGDSRTKKTLKRLHLYNKGTVTNVNCFNGDCPVKNKTVYSFLRDFFPSFLDKYKRETFGTTMKKLSDGFDVFENVSEKKKPQQVVTYDLSGFLTDIEQSSDAINYLSGRGIKYDESKYGKWYFGHQDLKIDDVTYKITGAIVIPLYSDGEMYGFYSRSITEKTFFTYMNDANIGYKLWNWFSVDKSQPVYIFEGIFDAISSGLPNVVAAIGAKIPDDRIKELKQPVFVYDNDKTGLLNSLTMSKVGHKVYVQPNDLVQKDINALKTKTEVDVKSTVMNNLYEGIMAEIRIKEKL